MTDLPAPSRIARLMPQADLGGFLRSVGPTAAAAALQLAVFALSARALGPEAFGALSAVYAFSVIGGEIVGLGADSAMVRDAATEPAGFAAAWGHVLALVALTWPPVAMLAVAAASAMVPALALGTIALLIFGEIILGRMTAAVELVMVAHGHPVRASLVRLASMSGRALVAILTFGVFGATSVETWAVVTFAHSLVTAAAMLAAVHRLYAAPLWGLDRAKLHFGFMLMLNQLARSLSGNLDRIVLAAIVAPAALGIYASGTRLLLLSAILTQSATRIFYPRFFRAAAAGRDELAALVRSTARQMAFVGLLSLALVAAAAQALPLLLGPAYAEVVGVASGLALASPFVALQYPPADALTADGRQALRTGIYLAGTALGVGLLAAGATAAGIPGAVAGFVLGQAGIAAALWLVWLRRGAQ